MMHDGALSSRVYGAGVGRSQMAGSLKNSTLDSEWPILIARKHTLKSTFLINEGARREAKCEVASFSQWRQNE